jgi:hypothetical protein
MRRATYTRRLAALQVAHEHRIALFIARAGRLLRKLA